MKSEIEKKQLIVGSLCAIACEILFGLSYLFTRTTVESVGAFELLAWRYFVAWVIMTLLMIFGIIKVNLKNKSLLPVIIIALFSPVLYFIGETLGIGLTSVSESGVILACIPIASLVMSALYLKKRPNRWQIIGILVTLLGVLITVFIYGASASFSIIGYLLLGLAVMSYAFYSVLVEKNTEYSDLELTYIMLAVGAIVFVAIALINALLEGSLSDLIQLPFTSGNFLIAILYQGVGCSILAYFLSNKAIAMIGVNRAASFIGVSTVVAILAGIFFLGESLSLLQLMGATIIVLGIYIANIKS